MRRGVNRRRFVQASAATVAGVGFFSSLAAQESKSPNEVIRFGCIGVGGKGASDSGDAKAHGNVVAICDIDEKTLNSAGEKKFEGAQRFADYRVMLEKVGKDIDAVTVSTPDHTHAVAAAMAMKMGKACFCQKPLTHDIWEARRLAEIAKEKKVATQMGNQGTSNDQLRKAVSIVKSGVLGDIKEVHVWTNRPIWAQGGDRPAGQEVPKHVNWDLFLGPSPERPYNSGYHPFAWRGWWDFGTGALGDMACHTFNMPYWAVDLADPTSVAAISSGHNRDSYPKWSQIEFEFPAIASRGAVKVWWYDGGKLPPKDIYDGPDKSGCVIVGSKGKLHGTGDYCGGIKLHGVDEPKVEFEKSPGHFKEFADAIKGGKPAKSNFPDYAGRLTETILLGNLAVYAANEKEVPGKKIEWDAKNLVAKNAPEVQHIVKREYRAGYTL
jgi:predicted dehydrogenase